MLRGSLGAASCVEGFISSFVRKLTVSSGVWVEVGSLGGRWGMALPRSWRFREPVAFGPAQGDRAGGSDEAQGYTLGVNVPFFPGEVVSGKGCTRFGGPGVGLAPG